MEVEAEDQKHLKSAAMEVEAEEQKHLKLVAMEVAEADLACWVAEEAGQAADLR